MRMKDKEGERDSSPFHHNLVISFDGGQLRQVVIVLVVRLLTEALNAILE
jgi:hypothetical protein